MLRADVPEPARQHDRLVVAVALTTRRPIDLLLVGPEVAEQVGTTELVVEGRAAERTLEHDRERRGDPVGAVLRPFPRPRRLGQAQVGHRKAGQTRLGASTAPRRAFVADLPTAAGRCPGKGRDGGRVVVGLDLHQDVDRFPVALVPARRRIDEEAALPQTGDHRRVVVIGAQDPLRVLLGRVADHRKQRMRLGLPVDHPVGIEDLVATVLRVGLGEHHELYVVRVATQLGEGRHQILDLIVRKREPEGPIGPLDRAAALAEHVDGRHDGRLCMLKQALGLGQVIQHGLGHPVVKLCQQRGAVVHLAGHRVRHPAFDPPNAAKSATMGDIGGLGRPGGNRPQPRKHVHRGGPRKHRGIALFGRPMG